MNTRETAIDYLFEGATLEAFVARPDHDQPVPVVMVAHMWAGRVPFVEDVARRMANLGYVGFALDLYGKGVVAQDKQECERRMQPFMQDRAMLQRCLLAAEEVALSLDNVDTAKYAAIGYCFGGLCVQDLARVSDRLLGAVSFHGLLTMPGNIGWPYNRARMLILHGNDDPLVNAGEEETIKRQMSDAGVDWQFVSFGNTVHAFTNPVANDPEFGTVYSPSADCRSWGYMTQFLTEIFE